MSKSKPPRRNPPQPQPQPVALTQTQTNKTHIEEFTFGDPVEVLDRREILDFVECLSNGRWYEPPIAFDGLARAFDSSPFHSSPITVKANIVTSTYVPHKLLSRSDFLRWVKDFLIFGDAFMEAVPNRLGGIIQLKPSLAKYTRVGVTPGEYWWTAHYSQEAALTGRVHHLMEADINQEIYGRPYYISGLNSALLNESSTLFRRRYYKNGSHAGVIFYMTDAAQDESYVNDFRTAIKNSKGPGNFKNLFLYAPGGKKDGIQVLPVSEAAAKDEFSLVKNTTRDDLMAVHRVPGQMMAVMPNNASGYGDIEKGAKVFAINEIEPLQNRLRELNDWLGIEVIRFDPYKLAEIAKG